MFGDYNSKAMPGKIELSPEDSLWLAILERNQDLARMRPEQARETLIERGFPKGVISAYLSIRHSAARAAVK
jgi:hypothetical protein